MAVLLLWLTFSQCLSVKNLWNELRVQIALQKGAYVVHNLDEEGEKKKIESQIGVKSKFFHLLTNLSRLLLYIV